MPQYSDAQLADFLKALDNAKDIEVDDWDAGFIGTNLNRQSFSPKQRVIVERMIERYGSRLKW